MIIEWRIIPDTDETFEVSNTGIIRRRLDGLKTVKAGRISAPEHIKGYLRVRLYFNKKMKRILVHRAVAECFVPGKEKGLQIDHIDGNRTNNNANNLRWCTPKENSNNPVTLKRRSQTMTGRFGKLHNQSKKIYCPELDMYFWGTYEVERETGINHRRVYEVISGKRKRYNGFRFFLC